MNANWQHDPISRWAYQLKEKSGWQKAVVALALEDFVVRSLQDVIPKMQSTGQTGGNPARLTLCGAGLAVTTGAQWGVA